MNMAWQDAVTIGIVLAAAVFLARHLLRWGRRKGTCGCGGCAKCLEREDTMPLIPLESLSKDSNITPPGK